MVIVEGNEIRVYTSTASAVFSSGVLTSLARKADGREFVKAALPAEGMPPLELIYRGAEAVPLGGRPGDSVTCLQLNERRAEVRVHSWNGDGVISISEDPESGDILVEPSGCASRPGLRACRWTLPGIADGLKLVAPFFQGVKLPLDDELVRNTHWHWPHFWEAPLAMLEGPRGGFWVHARDDRYRYKSLQVGSAADARRLGFESEAYGPIDDNLSAGGIVWRVNVFEGDWQTPAAVYRDWLHKAYGLENQSRPDWLADLRLAVSWCPCDDAILDALAKRVPPEKVLLHIPRWRTDRYDQNYPTYKASAEGKAFIQRAAKMGFRAMPHMNSIDMDPTHPVYPYLRDFQYREVESGRVQGWTWAQGQVMPVPESNAARLAHQDKNTMVKVHPGLAMWRSILAENVGGAAEDLGVDTVFLDVTLNTWNLRNCLVENATPTEGMKKLTSQVAALGGGLAVGGEGRNEITMQDQALSQVHLFMSWQESVPGLERTAGCPLNEFLFGRLCRSFGYTRLGGRDADEETRIKVHVSQGAMPTITVRSGRDVENPNRAVQEMLKQAGG